MTLNDILLLLSDPDRIRIIKGKEEQYTGFVAMFSKEVREERGLTGEEKVEKMRCIPEIRHKQWKEKGLMPPTEPEWAAQYSFSDLEMKLYYTITLKE